ncbi:hypothetical protein K443DRAFT_128470 [Laccaria amethystina LaAM-08-1]|uniref:holo-[acyl-carrier-protein] synthase n=1 Tax=Laccaria amethystina LaAM-08-1 TaxID=1095629 RepID=A0A0C9XUC9_9AGAR|nr:hypothetical protein K443DRAFT_128470 [Laccaria amethystina LaAM-08-1]
MLNNEGLRVWAVFYHQTQLSEELYHAGLQLVDTDSQARIKRFYQRDDACRTLIGRLLIRAVFRERGTSLEDIKVETTQTGKPYIVAPELNPPIGFNITHDNALIAMAFAPGVYNGPAFNVGIDVMKVRLPRQETLSSFVQTVGEQLTPHEHNLVFSAGSQEEGLRHFFWMWTFKEAYTKALGLGLGFEFKRVEFDSLHNVVLVDGKSPKGWRFYMFVLNDDDDLYQGVVAQYVGGITTQVIPASPHHDWLMTFDAASFVRQAID